MASKECVREPMEGLPAAEYLNERVQAGWKLVALEWERETETGRRTEWSEEIPYGLQVSPDCARLVQNPGEIEIIVLALDMIVEDCPLSRVADELNNRGYETRRGERWTPTALFNLLPRMIQIGPKLFVSEEWASRRQRLPRMV
ncbi:MAG: recombinase family protein [Acidobacteriia bacterium]|nr:recombinase family protein [Terriglobia bacterium]